MKKLIFALLVIFIGSCKRGYTGPEVVTIDTIINNYNGGGAVLSYRDTIFPNRKLEKIETSLNRQTEYSDIDNKIRKIRKLERQKRMLKMYFWF